MKRTAGGLLVAALLAGCTTTVTGTPADPPVVGTMLSSGPLDVTLVSFVDPAPLYQADEYDSKPEDDERLVAAQIRVHNTGRRDYLVDPTTEINLIAGGAELQNSFAQTTAGVPLDQVSLAPDQTVLGYLTFTVPTDARATEFRYDPMSSRAMAWQVAPGGTPKLAAPWPDARKGTHAFHEPATITGDGGQLIVAPIKVTDPATAQDRIDVGQGRHVVQVDFAVTENTGRPPPPDSDPVLRILTLYNPADESVRAHVYSTQASVEHPLTGGERTTWPVQFVVPDGFGPDHVSFRPEFGNTTTTIWSLS